MPAKLGTENGMAQPRCWSLSPDAQQVHTKPTALSRHRCAEVNTALNQFNASTTCSPHLTQLNVAQTHGK